MIGAAGYVGGAVLTAHSPVTPDKVNVQIPVTTTVQRRVVEQDQNVQGIVEAGSTIDVVPAPPAGTDASVVVSMQVKDGDEVGSGQLLGIVSNRPQFLLTTSIPFFRDLHVNDRGGDVTALQEGLTSAGIPTQVTGIFGSGTTSSIKKLYARAGATPPGFPGVAYFSATEVATMRPSQALVISAATVGDTITKDLPLATLQVSSNVVAARVNVLQQSAYAVGATVKLIASGYSGTGTVVSMSTFQAASDSVATAGYDVTVTFSTTAGDQAPPVSSPVTLGSSTNGPESLAVPTIAIRQDSHGTYVVLAPKGAAKKSTRIAVTVINSADGWSAITAASLEPGTKVSVQ